MEEKRNAIDAWVGRVSVLHQAGILSDEEFAAMKAKILQ
ncbi:MAG: SHOCT domain-containing protein [Caldilinea sp.]|nr:SHOCT domain-containing protein [Caldilinea sp.]